MENDVLAVIAGSTAHYSKGHRKIAKYILENYDKAAFMTAGKLGATVGVSESTVVRFAAELGYADQSHLANDFRTVLGFTPSAYRADAARTGATAPVREEPS